MSERKQVWPIEFCLVLKSVRKPGINTWRCPCFSVAVTDIRARAKVSEGRPRPNKKPDSLNATVTWDPLDLVSSPMRVLDA